EFHRPNSIGLPPYPETADYGEGEESR
ncbi:MAG: hypothetical protein QOE61_4489, partial [Micromonosporaceae bacterium]|nr:hypothetical protein [Micromonosporaceae bacterium]